MEQFSDCFLAGVPSYDLHDDGCLVLHVLQVRTSWRRSQSEEILRGNLSIDTEALKTKVMK